MRIATRKPMEDWHAKDRRRFVRFPVHILLKCCCDDISVNGPTRTQDISIKGLGVVTNEKLRLGSFVDLFLTMPDNGEEIQARGKVVWEDASQQYAGNVRLGIYLEEASLKPIPLVLRTMKACSP